MTIDQTDHELRDGFVLDGEDPWIEIRMVVAGRAGTFRRGFRPDGAGSDVEVAPGQLIGTIESLGEETCVASPFRGTLRGMLAETGERVRVGQPLAWLEL